MSLMRKEVGHMHCLATLVTSYSELRFCDLEANTCYSVYLLNLGIHIMTTLPLCRRKQDVSGDPKRWLHTAVNLPP